MPGILNNYGPTVLKVGAGFAVGVGFAVLAVKLMNESERSAHQLQELVSKVERLRQEVEDLKKLVETTIQNSRIRPKKQKRVSGYYSVHASSTEDEDEEYEEAYGENTTVVQKSQNNSTVVEKGERQSNGIEAGEDLFAQVDKLLDGTDEEKEYAFDLLKDKEAQLAKNAKFLWRMAKSAYLKSQIMGSKGFEEEKKTLVYSSRDYAAKSLDFDDRDPSAHKWYAITLGSIGDYEGTQVKIKNGYTFKEHIEKAIELNPADPSAHHLLGRWCFGVYMLSWVERQVASTLFATPPSATVDEALDYFLEADRLNPGKWKENMLFVGKCYIEKRDYYGAVKWLDKASTLQSVSQDDKMSQTEIDNLLYKYSGYR